MRKLHRLFCIALLALVSAAASEAPPDQLDHLRKENQALNDRVKELEKKLREAETRNLYTIPTPAPELKSLPFSMPNPLREHALRAATTQPDGSRNWQEKEFNGMKFYVIPLNSPEK